MPSTRTTLPGEDTLLACWTALTSLTAGARLVRTEDAVAAVFPAWAPLNNAILHQPSDDPTAMAARLESVYAKAGVRAWAVWLPSAAARFDAPDALHVGGYVRDTTTLVMHTDLRQDHPRHHGVVRTSIASVARLGDDPVPADDLEGPDAVPGLTGWALIDHGLAVTAAWGYLQQDDLGIYGVETVPGWRRRGFARALLQHIMADAAARGAHTASLQSTAMGQPLYASLGFTAAGRYEEWVPPVGRGS
jgi:GNAT superfamily N-acetyltransferase